MLHAIMSKVKGRYPYATFVMAPTPALGNRPFNKLVSHGFFPKASLWVYGIHWGDLANLMPKKLREMYGLVLDRDVDVVLDASGFSYSDQWGVSGSRELAHSSGRWSRQGTKLILLPQAFGPFLFPENRKSVRDWVKNSTLIFPRDSDSRNYLIDVVGDQDKIRQYPDFTNLVPGTLPADYNFSDKRVAIIPNFRMIDKTSRAESELYLQFLIRCAKYLAAKDAKPFVLIHEGTNDKYLAGKVSALVAGIPVVTEGDPLHIKGIIGTCDACIGSRFHGLASALSQGVPSLAAGWSHKYLHLLQDYDCENGVISVLASDDELFSKIDSLIGLDSSATIRRRLELKSKQLKSLSEEMWALVFREMDMVSRR